MYLVKFLNDGSKSPYWLADWEGDPGRTLVRENARQFVTPDKADRFAKRTIKRHPFRYHNKSQDYVIEEVKYEMIREFRNEK